MIFVLFAVVIFAFLVLGSIAFLVCVLFPPTRRFAQSTALWFAAWGPSSVALMVIAGLGLVAGGLAMNHGNMHWTDASKLLTTLGWSYLIVGVLVTAGVATCAALIHQFVIHRFTFALFRLYATAISAGIGSVLGWALGWWMVANEFNHLAVWLWALARLALVLGFGATAYKSPRALRGKAPTKLTWISPEEFTGSNTP